MNSRQTDSTFMSGTATPLGGIDAFIDLPQDIHCLLAGRGQCDAGINAELHALLVKAISELDGEDLLPCAETRTLMPGHKRSWTS